MYSLTFPSWARWGLFGGQVEPAVPGNRVWPTPDIFLPPWEETAVGTASISVAQCRKLSMQVHSVSLSSAETPVSHDTGWWFSSPWRHFLLPASEPVGNLSQGYSPPPSLPHTILPYQTQNTPLSDKVAHRASLITLVVAIAQSH